MIVSGSHPEHLMPSSELKQCLASDVQVANVWQKKTYTCSRMAVIPEVPSNLLSGLRKADTISYCNDESDKGSSLLQNFRYRLQCIHERRNAVVDEHIRGDFSENVVCNKHPHAARYMTRSFSPCSDL